MSCQLNKADSSLPREKEIEKGVRKKRGRLKQMVI